MLHGAEPRVHIMCTVGRPPPGVTHNELKFGEKSLSARSFLRLQPGKLNQWTAMMIPARHMRHSNGPARALTAHRGNCWQSATHTFSLLASCFARRVLMRVHLIGAKSAPFFCVFLFAPKQCTRRKGLRACGWSFSANRERMVWIVCRQHLAFWFMSESKSVFAESAMGKQTHWEPL